MKQQKSDQDGSLEEDLPKRIIDIHSNKSRTTGLAGIFESLLRSYRGVSFAIVTMLIIGICLIAAGLSSAPALFFHSLISEFASTLPFYFKFPLLGISVAVNYFVYGLTLIFVVPFFNLFCPKIKAWRGNWFSLQSVPWFFHNALTYIVRFTFLDFITPSPLNTLFFRMMGMKIGKGSMINTSYISDPALIILGNYVTIGGSATLFGHYGQKGILILSPVIIEDYVTVGLKASIMGDVRIGKGVIIPPHSILLPKTRIPAGSKVTAIELNITEPSKK